MVGSWVRAVVARNPRPSAGFPPGSWARIAEVIGDLNPPIYNGKERLPQQFSIRHSVALKTSRNPTFPPVANQKSKVRVIKAPSAGGPRLAAIVNNFPPHLVALAFTNPKGLPSTLHRHVSEEPYRPRV